MKISTIIGVVGCGLAMASTSHATVATPLPANAVTYSTVSYPEAHYLAHEVFLSVTTGKALPAMSASAVSSTYGDNVTGPEACANLASSVNGLAGLLANSNGSLVLDGPDIGNGQTESTMTWIGETVQATWLHFHVPNAAADTYDNYKDWNTWANECYSPLPVGYFLNGSQSVDVPCTPTTANAGVCIMETGGNYPGTYRLGGYGTSYFIEIDPAAATLGASWTPGSTSASTVAAATYPNSTGTGTLSTSVWQVPANSFPSPSAAFSSAFAANPTQYCTTGSVPSGGYGQGYTFGNTIIQQGKNFYCTAPTPPTGD